MWTGENRESNLFWTSEFELLSSRWFLVALTNYLFTEQRRKRKAAAVKVMSKNFIQCLHFQSTALEEFAWLALLEYRKGEKMRLSENDSIRGKLFRSTATGEISINCAGSLISHKYVLTAGHCLTGDIIHRVGSL